MTQATIATSNQGTTDINGSTNGSTNGSATGKTKTRAVPTPLEAMVKITKILEQLSPIDRKRVLDFVSTGSTGNE